MFPICISYSSRDLLPTYLLTSCVVVNGLQRKCPKKEMEPWNESPFKL